MKPGEQAGFPRPLYNYLFDQAGYNKLTSTLKRWGASEDDADDLAITTIIHVVEKYGSPLTDQNVRPLLWAVARNLLREMERDEYRSHGINVTDDQDIGEPDFFAHSDEENWRNDLDSRAITNLFADEDTHPENEFQSSDFALAWKLFCSKHPKYSVELEKFILDKSTVHELADMFGYSVKTMMQRLSIAKKLLWKQIESLGGAIGT